MDLITTIAAIVTVAGQHTADLYAGPVFDAAKRADVDPRHLVAYIQHESNFRFDAVSRDGEDVGLGQIRLRFQAPCRNVPRSHPDCKAEYYRLLEPRYNLRQLAGKVRAAKQGKAYAANPTPEQWLAALAGSTNPRHKRVREMMAIFRRIEKGSRGAP